MEFKITELGEKTIIVQFKQEISEEVHREVIHAQAVIEQQNLLGIVEIVPAYSSITIHYNPYLIWKNLKQQGIEASPRQYLLETITSVLQQEKQLTSYVHYESKIVEIPVCYGGKYGPDLQEVATFNDLTCEQVISLHSKQIYLVHMLGFAPGFPYLGGMDKRIAMPRKAIPRAVIEAGSVGIAGEQTGVYPISTPGGWRIIGRTPLQLFRPEQETPSLIQPGDSIKFISINEKQFEAIRRLEWT